MISANSNETDVDSNLETLKVVRAHPPSAAHRVGFLPLPACEGTYTPVFEMFGCVGRGNLVGQGPGEMEYSTQAFNRPENSILHSFYTI